MDPHALRSWPRFVEDASGLAPAARRPGPSDPWPRWGWFPRDERTWTFVPGPALIVHTPVAPHYVSPTPPGVAGQGRGDEPVEARPIGPRFVQGLAPSEQATATAVVPARRELMLIDAAGVVRAARRAAPVAAVAGVVAITVLTLFRRR